MPNSIRPPARRVLAKSTDLIGFVARSFEGKGGREVVDAFRLARSARPNLTLECVGHPPPTDLVDEAGIVWWGEVPRAKLLNEILPRWAAMIYPTHADGVPYSVIEALAAACPVVTTNYRAMPELVPHRVAGVVCRDRSAASLASGIRSVLNTDDHHNYVKDAAKWFDAHYSIDATRASLLRAYANATGTLGG